MAELLRRVQKNGKWGFADRSGKVVIPCQWEDSWNFCEGLAAVKLEGKWGYLDMSGVVVIPCQWDKAYSFFVAWHLWSATGNRGI